MINQEFLKAFRAELDLTRADFARLLETIVAAPADAPEFAEALEVYAGQVERLGSTAAMLGMRGLETFCAVIGESLLAMAALDPAHRDDTRPYFELWPDLVAAYIDQPADFSAAESLVTIVSNPPCPQPIDEARSLDLMTLLTQEPELPAELAGETAPPRQTTATLDDVDLRVPADVDRNVYEAMLSEAPEQVAELSQLMQRLAEGKATREQIFTVKRLAHSFKGTANICGVRGVATLAHHVEDILEYLEIQQAMPPRALARVLVSAADCLEQMIQSLLGTEAPPEDGVEVLQSVLDWAHRIDAGDMSEPDETADTPIAEPLMPASTGGEQAQRAPAAVIAPAVSNDAQADPPPVHEGDALAPATERPAAETAPTLRVASATVDELFRLVGEMSVRIGQLSEEVKESSQRAQSLLKQNLQVQGRLFELETLVDVRGLGRLKAVRSVANEASFDALEMDQYNELHSASRALIEEATDARELSLRLEEDIAGISRSLAQHIRIQKDLQHLVMQTRMTPVSQLVPRLSRIVRQTCQKTGKHAQFLVEGGDILVDGDMLARLADPLLHILRNAVDHGIESPAERAAVGKGDSATIKLTFSRRGQAVTVRCSDDGRGLDLAAIRHKGIERGLITAAQEISTSELTRLIFAPGFSTRESVNEISGRGVGLDVVRDRIQSMKGSVDVSSDAGRGCDFVLRFQASLVAQHALLVAVCGQTFAVPSYQIEQAVAPGLGEIVRVGAIENLVLGGKTYPIVDAAELLAVRSTNAASDAQCPYIIVKTDSGAVAIIVERVIDGRDLILKSAGRYVQGFRGLAGLSILGNGVVAPLIDFPELLRAPASTGVRESMQASAAQALRRRVMIVDDSMSVRRSLTQLIEDAGYETRAAKDGLEAVTMLKGFGADVVLTDLEMPNMNGLELTQHLRGQAATRDVPIIMITSRSMDKHRRQAEGAGVNVYLTKPYGEAELLGHIEQALLARAA